MRSHALALMGGATDGAGCLEGAGRLVGVSVEVPQSLVSVLILSSSLRQMCSRGARSPEKNRYVSMTFSLQ